MTQTDPGASTVSASAARGRSGLRSIGYVSSATLPMDEAALERLLAQSRCANAASSITGMLLHCSGNFMQVLEGPAPALSDTFARIACNAAHHCLIQLFDEPIERREFGGWSMACRELSDRQFDALRVEGSLARQLLADFWRANA